MKCSLGISNFLEEISSLSHCIVFFYFFALITEEGFLISPCYFLELCIQMGISFLFSFAFHFSSFTAICKVSSDSHFPFFALLFLQDGLAPCLSVSQTSIHSSSGALSIRPSPLNLSHFHCIVVRDLIYVILDWSIGFPTFFSLSLNLTVRSS